MELTEDEVVEKKAQGFYTWKLSFMLGKGWYAVLPSMFLGNLMNTEDFPGSRLVANVRSVFFKDKTSPSGVRQLFFCSTQREHMHIQYYLFFVCRCRCSIKRSVIFMLARHTILSMRMSW